MAWGFSMLKVSIFCSLFNLLTLCPGLSSSPENYFFFLINLFTPTVGNEELWPYFETQEKQCINLIVQKRHWTNFVFLFIVLSLLPEKPGGTNPKFHRRVFWWKLGYSLPFYSVILVKRQRRKKKQINLNFNYLFSSFKFVVMWPSPVSYSFWVHIFTLFCIIAH